MADVFISYKTERRPAVEHLTRVIENHGFSVWFDYGLLSGEAFAPQIEREIRAARATLVLWCPLSVNSRWVREEATTAQELSTLIPIMAVETPKPFGFKQLDTIDLTAWDGSPRSSQLDRLLDQISIKAQREPLPNFRALAEQDRAWRGYGSLRFAQFPLDAQAGAIESNRFDSNAGKSERLEVEGSAGIGGSQHELPQNGFTDQDDPPSEAAQQKISDAGAQDNSLEGEAGEPERRRSMQEPPMVDDHRLASESRDAVSAALADDKCLQWEAANQREQDRLTERPQWDGHGRERLQEMWAARGQKFKAVWAQSWKWVAATVVIAVAGTVLSPSTTENAESSPPSAPVDRPTVQVSPRPAPQAYAEAHSRAASKEEPDAYGSSGPAALAEARPPLQPTPLREANTHKASLVGTWAPDGMLCSDAKQNDRAIVITPGRDGRGIEIDGQSFPETSVDVGEICCETQIGDFYYWIDRGYLYVSIGKITSTDQKYQPC